MKKTWLLAVFYAVIPVLCYGQSSFIRGEELFMQNKPEEALLFLENSIAEDSANVKAFLYLGIVYEQLNRTDEAIAVYRKILPRVGGVNTPSEYSPYILTNLANVYFKKGDAVNAEEFYNQAIGIDPLYSAAYLGRANTRIKAAKYKEAVVDYGFYITLEPRSPKRPEIERMIAFIRAEIAAEERKKLLAEEAAREEAERRQRLLDELAASLLSAADDSKGLSSGAENVEGYDGEFELE